jgi:hypothetical protein
MITGLGEIQCPRTGIISRQLEFIDRIDLLHAIGIFGKLGGNFLVKNLIGSHIVLLIE